jgi:3-dehydroquinate synthase
VDDLIDHMRHDKKVLKGKMRFILLREIGNSFITSDIMPENVAQILSKSIGGKL